MQTATKQTVTVREGGLIEFRVPEVPTGAIAEVIILWEIPDVDERTDWSEEDMRDVARYSLSNALGDEEGA